MKHENVKFQVRYHGIMSNEPMSKLYDSFQDAKKEYEIVKADMINTWKTPDPENLHIDIIRLIVK